MSGKFKTMTIIDEAELARLRDKEISDYNPTVRSMSTIQDSINKIFDDPKIPDDEKMKLINSFQEKFAQLYSKFKTASNVLPNALLAAVTAMKPKSPPKLVNVHPTEHVEPEADEEEFHEAQGDMSQQVTEAEGDLASNALPISFTPTPTFAAPISTAMSPLNSLTTKQIGLPSQYERKLSMFQEFLNENEKDIHGNSKDELVLDGKVIPNSSFSNLVYSMYLRNQQLNLNGFSDFISKLASLKSSPDLFSNKLSISELNSRSSTKKPIQTRTQSNLKGKGMKRKIFLFNHTTPPGKKPRILHMFRI